MRRRSAPILLAACLAATGLAGCASYHPPLDRTRTDTCEILAVAVKGLAADHGALRGAILAQRTYTPGWNLLEDGGVEGWTRAPNLDLAACPALVGVLGEADGPRLAPPGHHRFTDEHLSAPAISPDGRRAVVMVRKLDWLTWVRLRKADSGWVYDSAWNVVVVGQRRHGLARR